jgi:hypothetical protein
MNSFASRLIAVLATSAVTIVSAAPAIADSAKLKGSYATTTQTVCLVSTTFRGPGTLPPFTPGPVIPSGFNPTTFALKTIPNPLFPCPGCSPVVLPFTNVITISTQGVQTFNGDGTGTVTGRSVSLSTSPTNDSPNFRPNVNRAEQLGEFTYEVAPDGTITTNAVTDSLVTTFLDLTTGVATGRTSINSGFSLKGQASANNQGMTLATEAPEIEYITFSPDGDKQERICHRSRTLVRMK